MFNTIKVTLRLSRTWSFPNISRLKNPGNETGARPCFPLTYIGIDNVKLIHLNDSKGAAGSGLDRREHIGCGKIGLKGLKQFINNPACKAVHPVLETPGKEETDDPANIDRVRKMMNAQ